MTQNTPFKNLFVASTIFLCLVIFSARAEVPGQFRPKPVEFPTEDVGAKGTNVQPADTFPVSRAPLVNTAHRKPKLSDPGEPTLNGSDLVFNHGWELIEAPRLKNPDGVTLSKPGVNTHDWYDATVPGTVLTTLVNEGVYPDPYYGLNNLLIPESLNKQDYWYRTEFTIPGSFDGRKLELQFKGINYYAEVWFNGEYLGHITGAFIRGNFDVTRLAKVGDKNVLAVMLAPPPDPGNASEESIKEGPGDNGGKLCLDGPTFVSTEGWDWIPSIRDRDTGLWQDVILHSSGPVTIQDPQVITKLPLPDTSRADITVAAGLHNASVEEQSGILRGQFEGATFEQPVTLKAGETKTVTFDPAHFLQLTIYSPRLWWPNGYGKPELYHLHLSFITSDRKESDHATVHFGVREMSYEFGAKKTDGKTERVEFTPILARGTQKPIIDNRRDTMVWGPENKARRDAAIIAAGGKVPTTPFHWGQGQDTTVAFWPGMENSPAIQPAGDTGMSNYLVIKVNGRRIECLGGDWGMDDAMKRVSREQLEPYIRLTRDANLNIIRNWAGQSTSEAFYDLCDEYGIMVWNEFWMNTEHWNYRPVDEPLLLSNIQDAIKRFRNHPSIALWCSQNEGVPREPVNEAIDRMVRELDGTRYYQPNSRLVNLDNSGPWSNLPLDKYFKEMNRGFTTELGATDIPSLEEMRTFIPAPDLWPIGDVWTYHDLHSKGGASDKDSTFERISARYGAPKDAGDLCRKAQMLNYETYRAMFEGFNSRLWHDCSGCIIWMTHPSWNSTVMQIYSWDYDPNAALFGAKSGAEPVHIQMNLPDCKIAIVNHHAEPLEDVTATATVYDLAGRPELNQKAVLTAPADACTDAFVLNFPATGAHLVRLELRDKAGRLLSQNFYWQARDERQLQELNSMPQVKLSGTASISHDANGSTAEIMVSNPGKVPALAVHVVLRDKAGQRILPVYYDDNFFSLLPGESRIVRVETRTADEDLHATTDGWNVKAANLD